MTIEDNDLTGSLDPIFCDVATDYQEIDRFKFPNMRNLESDCLVPPTTKPPGGVETVTENDVTATTSNHTTNNTNDDNGDDHDYHNVPQAQIKCTCCTICSPVESSGSSHLMGLGG